MISLRLPEQAQLEVEAAGDRQRGKTMNRLVPQAYITTDEEKRTLKTIEDIISPMKPLSKNEAADAMNVFHRLEILCNSRYVGSRTATESGGLEIRNRCSNDAPRETLSNWCEEKIES